MVAKQLALAALLVVAAPRIAGATEICGNAIDDDSNGLVDEGCAPTLTTGVCESPLSCADTGMISWSTGALHYDLPPDINPRVPYGPSIGWHRLYTSMYSPPSGGIPNINAKPMGANWQHTYMTWVTSGGTGKLVLHTPQGQDVLFASPTTVSGWTYYTPQAGYHVLSFKQNTVSPFQIQEQLLTGETITFNNLGQLTTITDTAGQSVAVTSDANGSVSTVTDASGKRRLLFSYTGTTLNTVQLQLLVSSTWTTEHTTTLTYTSGVLTSATVGSQLAQKYVYTSGLLTAIQDGSSNGITSFAYSSSVTGRVNRVDTPRGSVGFDFGATRSGCPVGGGTQILFNRASATVTCTTDSDCATTGTGNMCGGKTGGTGTGVCYQAGRCLTLGTAGGESVVTAATPVLDAASKPCDGVCADVMAYVWSTGSGLVNVLGKEDGASRFTSAVYNSNGLPTEIGYGDIDSDPTNGASRVEYLYYDTTYPGRIAEIRRASDLSSSASSCSSTSTTGCARTVYTYNSTSPYLLHTVQNIGTTLTTSATQTGYTYTTTYTQDGNGRTTEVDGPLSGAKTVYDYWSSTDPTKNGFLEDTKQYATATAFLTTTYFAYDVFGNAIGITGVDGNVTCRTFDSSRDFLTQTRRAMAGQTDCTTTNAADLTTNWLRDSALRLTEMQRPDGSCVLYSYALDSTSGRYLLHQVKRRDDCLSTSSGDTQQYVYSTDGLVTELDTYDASGTLTAKQPYDYYKSRHLHHVVNPVNTSYTTAFGYDQSGMLTEVDDPSGLGEMTYLFGPNTSTGSDSRVTNETRYYSSTGTDTWNFTYDFDGDQASYEDGDRKDAYSTRDDMGREVQRALADFPTGTTTVMVYDAAGNMTTREEGRFLSIPVESTFTYDYLNRRLSVTYSGSLSNTCSIVNPATTWTYDQQASCPTGMGTCTNQNGRLAAVTTSLSCGSAYADNSLDQTTTYSYDAAGREVEEFIKDDTSRTADQLYTWTKNGELATTSMPSSTVFGWTFGSTGNNSDTDLTTGIYRGTTATPVIDTVQWFPFGPIQQYNHENFLGTPHERTRITRNLAYRITNLRVEPTDMSGTVFNTAIAEDAKGRVTQRVYSSAATGVQSSYFLYDNEDHLQCETTSSVSSCPTTAGSTVKNSHYQAPPFTHAGDWKNMLRPIPGASTMENDFSLNTGTHQIASVNQVSSGYGTTSFTYNALGNRTSDTSSVNTHDERDYTYDARGNVTNVRGQWWTGSAWHYYDIYSTFDARNRRVYKGSYDETSMKTGAWYFYYDALDRLTEIKYFPDSSVVTNYSIYQLVWLRDRMVSYWETDYPSATTSRRYTGTDESGRIVDMQSWPSSGSATRVWAVSPSAWGYDTPILGNSVFQPLVFPGQYIDNETTMYTVTSGVYARPGLLLNGFREYDPFTGGFLQVDPLVPDSQSTYVYADSDPVEEADPSGLRDCQEYDCGDPGNASDGGGGGGGGGTCDHWWCGATCATVGSHFGCDCSLCVPVSCSCGGNTTGVLMDGSTECLKAEGPCRCVCSPPDGGQPTQPSQPTQPDPWQGAGFPPSPWTQQQYTHRNIGRCVVGVLGAASAAVLGTYLGATGRLNGRSGSYGVSSPLQQGFGGGFGGAFLGGLGAAALCKSVPGLAGSPYQ